MVQIYTYNKLLNPDSVMNANRYLKIISPTSDGGSGTNVHEFRIHQEDIGTEHFDIVNSGGDQIHLHIHNYGRDLFTLYFADDRWQCLRLSDGMTLSQLTNHNRMSTELPWY